MAFEYYEYKYQIPNEQLDFALALLDKLSNNVDPYPQGHVNTVYFDSLDRRSCKECANGEELKRKFRIRFYGEDNTSTGGEIQVKEKEINAVNKYKCKYEGEGFPLEWPQDMASKEIEALSKEYLNLEPIVVIKYLRYRYRFFDYRITLDTNIQAENIPGKGSTHLSMAQCPVNILEIKSQQERPHIPFLGLLKARQVSFSKFYFGVQCLNYREEAWAQYYQTY